MGKNEEQVEVFFDGVSVKVKESEGVECCFEGTYAYASLEHAVILQKQPGFDYITDEVIEYRERRCAVADDCDTAKIGKCALAEAGMLSPIPV